MKSSPTTTITINGQDIEAKTFAAAGGLAVCRPFEVKGWAGITHVQSGHLVMSTRTIVSAKEAMAKLLALPIDWKGEPETLLQPIKDNIDAISTIRSRHEGR